MERPSDITLDLDVCAQEELAIRNAPGEINRALVQQTELAAKVHIRTSLHRVHYGTYDSKPATLIIFRSQFVHSNASGGSRLKSALLRFSFTDQASSSRDLSLAPRIREIFPVHARSWSETVRATTKEFGIGASLNVGGITGGLLSANMPQIATTKASTSFQRRYTEVNGLITTAQRKSPRAENRSLWTIDEDESAKDGIPRMFSGAVLLNHHPGRPFQMKMEVETRQGLLKNTAELLRKSTRGADEPVMFVPGSSYSIDSKEIPDTFDDISLQELVDLPANMIVDV